MNYNILNLIVNGTHRNYMDHICNINLRNRRTSVPVLDALYLQIAADIKIFSEAASHMDVVKSNKLSLNTLDSLKKDFCVSIARIRCHQSILDTRLKYFSELKFVETDLSVKLDSLRQEYSAMFEDELPITKKVKSKIRKEVKIVSLEFPKIASKRDEYTLVDVTNEIDRALDVLDIFIKYLPDEEYFDDKPGSLVVVESISKNLWDTAAAIKGLLLDSLQMMKREFPQIGELLNHVEIAELKMTA